MSDPADTTPSRLAQQQTLVVLTSIGYVLGAALMAGYALMGLVPFTAPVVYLLLGLGLNLALQRWLRRRRDEADGESALPAALFLIGNALVQLGFVVWTPQIGGLLLLVLVGLIPAEAIHLRARVLLGLMLLLTALTLGAFVLAPRGVGIPSHGPLQQFIAWGAFGVVVGLSTALNLLRERRSRYLVQRSLELREVFASFRHYAFKDELTGLANRRAFAQQLARHLRDAPEQPLAVALIDLDRFKSVNDRLGHAVGDQLLVQVGKRLRSALRQDDLLARLGGDEFVALLVGYRNEAEVRAVAQRLLKSLDDPLPAGEHLLQMGMSLGLVLHDGASPVDGDTLLRRADLAMYAAKEGGRQQYRLFDPALENALQDHERQLARVLAALREGRLELHYQPVLGINPDAPSGEQIHVASAEALLRLRDADGLHSASEFERVLDDEAVSRAVGRFVLGAVFDQAAAWHAAGRPLRLSANISPRHFLDPQFLSDLRSALERHPDCPPELLTLELTEHGSELDSAMARFVVSRCQRLGVRVSLDDFGTGSASLTHLQELEVSAVKIDRSFTRDLFTSGAGLSIAYGLLRTAHLMRLDVVAEGVSTVQHALALVAMSCRQLQGYAIARPMPATDLAQWADDLHGHLPWARALLDQQPIPAEAVQALVQHSTTASRAERGTLSAAERRRLSRPNAQNQCLLGLWCRDHAAAIGSDRRYKRLVREHHVFHTRLRELLALGAQSSHADAEAVRQQSRLVRHRFWNLMLVDLAADTPQQTRWPAAPADAAVPEVADSGGTGFERTAVGDSAET